MLPVIAIIGRPNVGKSTLFNRLTHSRDALVANLPGLTRDRQYGEGEFADRKFIVIDTGGIETGEQGLQQQMLVQSQKAMAEADILLFMVDARAGLTPADELIVNELRKSEKQTLLLVNKIDGLDADIALGDFYKLGMEQVHGIAASHGRGVNKLLQAILNDLPEVDAESAAIETRGIKVAVIGRPNVGKSTLINRILGEERVVVFDQAGTTRDSIYIPFERRGKQYTMIDTAGIRRRGKVKAGVEKFSIIKTLKAIEDANVIIYIIDAQEGVVEQDLSLIGFVLDAGKALIVTVNKWDGLEPTQKEYVKKELSRRLTFIDFVKMYFISALHGTNVGNLFTGIDNAYHSATIKLATSKVNNLLAQAVASHPPPLVHGHRIKLRYAHMGGQNPPLIVIHGNQTERLPMSYKRYLVNHFRTALKLVGTPIRLEFKTSENPFQGRKNVMTERQKQKRKRLIRHKKR